MHGTTSITPIDCYIYTDGWALFQMGVISDGRYFRRAVCGALLGAFAVCG